MRDDIHTALILLFVGCLAIVALAYIVRVF